MRNLLLFVAFAVWNYPVVGQQTIPLYTGAIPNSLTSPNLEKTENRDGIEIISKISVPTLTIFLPSKEKSTGAAVVICPGGGYWINAFSHEGTDVANKFNELGVAAFVLKYRIPDDLTMVKKEIGPIQDAQQALMLVRQRAKEWGIDINRVGIMGFSAGGHLASTAGTHFEESFIDNFEKINLRPDFMMLIYPVISFQENVTHSGSKVQLIGKNPSAEKINFFSNELHVTKTTPPTFEVHASDDGVVSPQNSIVFYENLIKNKVPAELHIYQAGGHGFGLNNKSTSDQWMDRCASWLESNGWLTKNR